MSSIITLKPLVVTIRIGTANQESNMSDRSYQSPGESHRGSSVMEVFVVFIGKHQSLLEVDKIIVCGLLKE